ncbi:MAG: ATP-dependent helicase [Deltaproteobacteria bacterium]|jgi:DNA helicase-2/ATP-dependent DNA helicase PcrA|nr:ATP-dependent helicase [Deltaproteobacteria bacterium]
MIDYEDELNPAQLEAVNALDGPVLVIAGAGSGKTRTIVYRLARLVERGIPASSILLLTFTRKAAQEMLERARRLLQDEGDTFYSPSANSWVQGGTFHSFAYSVLRLFPPEGYSREATVMDSGDALSLLKFCREEIRAGKGDRSFPRDQTIMALLSKSRNREQELEEILRRESAHLLPHAEAMLGISREYAALKRSRSLLDYDDLLFELETLLHARTEALDYCRRRYRYLMLDEFQDTNLVQSRLAALIAGTRNGAPEAEAGGGNIMAVGDDAQSIYAFRGANVRNILDFPQVYPGTRLIRLEENYRSTQPLLNLCNSILEHAGVGFKKRLFTSRSGGILPQVLRPSSDLSQGMLAASKVEELLREFAPHEIAVLFRAGYQSYHTELCLNKKGISFRKYGGLRYAEASHIKDVLAFVRLTLNPLDLPAFQRIAAFVRGIGSKTSLKLHRAMQTGERKTLEKAFEKYPELRDHLEFLDGLRLAPSVPVEILEKILEHYRPVLERQYPDDYPRRSNGLDELLQIAASYADLDLFAAELSLEDPSSREERRDSVTLSTIHSAKGLEWGAVLVLDLVESRFPSGHALSRAEDFEEERRLMYVACTRAKRYLALFVPEALYLRGGGAVPASPSPFVRELSPDLYDDWHETYSGLLRPHDRLKKNFDPDRSSAPALPEESPPAAAPAGEYGYCTHKIFGRGKIVRFLPPDKYQVNFKGVGLKVIMASFLDRGKA